MKVGILGLAVVAMTSAASAAPLGLSKAYPDLYSDYVGVFYTASTDTLDSVGAVERLYTALNTYTSLTDGYYDLAVTVDSAGNATGGTVQFYAREAGPATPYVTVLSGTLASNGFGYSASGGDIFEFIFNVNSGTMAAQFGSQFGMILNANFGSTSNGADFNGTFTSNFGNSVSKEQYSIGTLDTFAVPEPASFALMGIAGVGLLLRKR